MPGPIEANVHGIRFRLARARRQIDALIKVLDGFEQAKDAQERMGMPLTQPQKLPHLTKFSDTRALWDTATHAATSIIDSDTFIDISVEEEQ